MIDSTEKLVTLKIAAEARDWVKDEQARLRKATGVEPTYTELFNKMVHAYKAMILKIEELPVPQSPFSSENQALHEKLEKILNSGDEGIVRAVVPNIEIFFDRLKPGRATPRRTDLPAITENPEETRLLTEYRHSSYEKRRRMLAFVAKEEDLGPEVMPGHRTSARRKSG